MAKSDCIYKEINTHFPKNFEAHTIPVLPSVTYSSSTSASARNSTTFLNVICYFQHNLRQPFCFMVTTLLTHLSMYSVEEFAPSEAVSI